MIYSSLRNNKGQLALAMVVTAVVVTCAAFLINYAVNFSKVSKNKSKADMFKIGTLSIMNYVELGLKKRWKVNDHWMKGGNNDVIANIVDKKGRIEKTIQYAALSDYHPIRTVMTELNKDKIDAVRISVSSTKGDISACFEAVKAPIVNPAIISVTLISEGSDIFTATSCVSFRNIPIASFAAILYGGLDLDVDAGQKKNVPYTTINTRHYPKNKFNPNAMKDGKYVYYKTQFLSPIRVHGDIKLPGRYEGDKELVRFTPVLFRAPITLSKTAPDAEDGVVYRGKNRYSPKFINTERAFYSEKEGLYGLKGGISFKKFNDPGLYCIYNPKGGDCVDSTRRNVTDRHYCNDTNTMLTDRFLPLPHQAPYRLARNRIYDPFTRIEEIKPPAPKKDDDDDEKGKKTPQKPSVNNFFYVRNALLGYRMPSPMAWNQMGRRNWFFKEVSSFHGFDLVVNGKDKRSMKFPSNILNLTSINKDMDMAHANENVETIYFNDTCTENSKGKCLRYINVGVAYAPYKGGQPPRSPSNFHEYDYTLNLSEFLIVIKGKGFGFKKHEVPNELARFNIRFENLKDVSGRPIFNRAVDLRALLHMSDRVPNYPLEFISKYNDACVNNQFSVDINKSYRYAHESWDITYDTNIPNTSGKRDLVITSNSGGGIKVVDPKNQNKMDGAKEILLKYNEDLDKNPDSFYSEGNILIRTVANKCVINGNVTFVAGLLFCKEELLIKSRFQDLDIVGTIITKRIRFEDQKPKYRTRFMSLLSSEGITLLKRRGILLNQANMGKCKVPWHKDAPGECLQKMFRTNPTYLARKAEPFMWPKITPDCVLEGDQVVCKRLRNFILEEYDRKYYFGSP